MGRSKEFDPTIVLHKAMEVFGQYGYEGTSLQNLIDELGIARQSIYDTYGTKRDLFISAVKYYVNEKTAAVISYLERSGSVKKSISDIFHGVEATLNDELRSKECFIMHSAIAQVPHDLEITEFLEKDITRLENAFYEALVRAKKQGELSNNHKDLLALARYLNHARYSLTQVAKLTNDPQVLKNVIAVTLSVLDI